MFGKAFSSMYKGSMMGAGSPVFAVWGYVIANMAPDNTVGCQVELNPEYLAAVIGDSIASMQKAIDMLCSPDPKSRTPDEEGRRLIRLGQFDYRVVNGVRYLMIRNEEDRREKARVRQRKHRQSSPPEGGLQRYIDAPNEEARNAVIDDQLDGVKNRAEAKKQKRGAVTAEGL